MTSTVRRAGAFAAVGTMALAVPVFEAAAAAPFALIAALAVFQLHEGRLFELFARPGERREGRLYGLIGFTLAASGLILFSAVSPMPPGVAVGTILLIAYGNLAVQVVRSRWERPFVNVAVYAAAGAVAFLLGEAVSLSLLDRSIAAGAPVLVFLAASGGLFGALLRSVLTEADDPYVMLSVGLGLWLLSMLTSDVGVVELGSALGITVLLGYVSYALGTASITGMLTGVSVGLVTIVLGGYGWFAVLIAFFGIGGLSTKFRYDAKLERGVAEDNEGARGSGNVLANSAVGLVAVLAFAAAPVAPGALGGLPGVSAAAVRVVLPPDGTVFLFAFVGSLATAMSDTLSSEVGGVFDDPRLITTLERVDPGTDGGVTWQGELAGVAGAAVVAGIALLAIAALGPVGAGVVVVAGVVGMTVDSLLGATVEGSLLDNAGVNFLATLAGAVVAATLALALGLA